MNDHANHTRLVVAAVGGLAVLALLVALELPGRSNVALIVIFVISPLMMLMARGTSRRDHTYRRP